MVLICSLRLWPVSVLANLHFCHQLQMDLSKKWTNAAVWKWCDLDGHPHDNVVSRHELFPVRAPLQVLKCLKKQVG